MKENTREKISNLAVCIFVIVLFLPCSFCYAKCIESPFNGLKLEIDEEVESYSFLIAGHLYGSSVFPASSILAAIDMINETDATFFVTLGDIIGKTEPIYISSFKSSFASRITIPLFNSPGNHDLSDRLLYERNFGKTYFDFTYGNSLFVFLDTELDNKGQIKGEQLKHFQYILKDCISKPEIKNVFIFSHKLIWSAHNPDYHVVFAHLNYNLNYPPSNSNLKQDIEPYLIELSSNNKAVYWFSGDIGCPSSLAFFYGKVPGQNITYIATGIGNTIRDGIIKVNVAETGEVMFTPISLTGQKLQPIEYYNISYWKNYFNEQSYIEYLIRKTINLIKMNKKFLVGAMSAFIFTTIFFMTIFYFICKYLSNRGFFYRNNINKRPRVEVKVMLLKNNEVLLGRRNKDPVKTDSLLHVEGTWTLPGGKLDFGEKIEDYAYREILEETSIKINKDSIKIVSVTNDVVEDAHFVTLGFLCEEFEGEAEVTEPDEITEWKWFDINNLPSPMFFPSEKTIKNFINKENRF